jgi:hypothetical protein
MKDDDNKSVLAFYAIPYESIIDMSIQNIWLDYVMTKADGVSCRNIFSSDLPVDDLLDLVKNIDNNFVLLSQIKEEYELGANVLFVSPVVGGPQDGFLLNDLFFK